MTAQHNVETSRWIPAPSKKALRVQGPMPTDRGIRRLRRAQNRRRSAGDRTAEPADTRDGYVASGGSRTPLAVPGVRRDGRAWKSSRHDRQTHS
ncbi:putative ATPase [Mycolicibacterium thermoresistibile]|uniref:Putative ATPase n=1 Tax=Mycolicibacterium thermoresistibile TaxID=1797 RepID=A0A117INV0_MYCTH|nr:putative ATPase [Mycolicibacterium thermoresistibile]